MSACARFLLLLAILVALGGVPLRAQRGIHGLELKTLPQLSQSPSTPLQRAALALSPERWQHAETAHFIYHFFNSHVATPVAVEAEFYQRIVSADLKLPASLSSAGKNQIFLFEEPALWRAFQSKAEIDPWSGGIHSGGSVFLLRDRAAKFKGRTLGHEIVHALLQQHIGELPLWLNEGYAEYASIVGHASFMRARNYAARPRSDAVDPARYIPLARLVKMQRYPEGTKEVEAFYAQSQRLVNFLQKRGKDAFLAFLRASANGQDLERALSKSYGGVFNSLDDLETEFRPYAIAAE